MGATRIPGRARTRGSIRLPWHSAPARKRRPDSIRSRITGKGLRRYSLSSARTAREVGPTQAARSGIHGHPENSCSGGLGLPSSHSRKRYVTVDSLPVVSSSMRWRERAHMAPSCSGGSSGHQRGHPTVLLVDAPLAEASLHRAAGLPESHRSRAWLARSRPPRSNARRRRPVGSVQDEPRTYGQPPSRFLFALRDPRWSYGYKADGGPLCTKSLRQPLSASATGALDGCAGATAVR